MKWLGAGAKILEAIAALFDMACGLEWLQQHEQRLLQHPFLTPTGFESRKAPSTWSPESPSPRAVVLQRSPGSYYASPRPSEPWGAQERLRADEASRLWQRAEAAHADATKENGLLRKRLADAEAAAARAEQRASDEAERRKAAEASARQRQRELGEERWRADEALRELRRAEAEAAEEQARAGVREREVKRLETTAAEADRAHGELAAAKAREAAAIETSQRDEQRRLAAEATVGELRAEIERLKIEMKENLDAEHERGERAKEAIRARAARDRERARRAEVNAARKAQELLQLWQRFQLLQREAGHSPDDKLMGAQQDDDAASAITSVTQQDALRAKIDQARRGLESSQRKLIARSRRASGDTLPDETDDHDGFVTPPPID